MSTPRAQEFPNQESIVRQSRASRRGYTLIEMALSLSLVSVLLAGLGSIVILSTKTLPAARTVAPAVETARTVQALAEDVSDATAVLVSESDTIEVRVPDRDGDHAEETIRLELIGSTVRRTYNGVEADRAEGVAGLDIRYTIGQADQYQEARGLYTAGPEPTTPFGIYKDVEVGCFVAPTLPPGVTGYRMTGVCVKIRKSATGTGRCYVTVRNKAADHLPGPTVLGTLEFNLSKVETTWTDLIIDFASPIAVADTSGVWLTITTENGSQLSPVAYLNSGSPETSTPNTYYGASRCTNPDLQYDGGFCDWTGWSTLQSSWVVLGVYGLDDNDAGNLMAFRHVGMTLTSEAAPAEPCTIGVSLVNHPMLGAP